MLLKFSNKRISSIITVLPSKEIDFMDETGNYSFSESQMRKLKKVMGFDKRRIADEGDTVGEYAVAGIRQLLSDKVIDLKEIGAIIVVTTSPDYFIPPTSNAIQGSFDFSQDLICMDISQGCCGYVVGLVQSFMALDAMKDKKVLLVAGDMLSHKVSKRDRASRPITGDGVTVSVIENSEDVGTIYCDIKNNGKAAFSVYIPAGGTKIPITPETTKETEDEFGNWRGQQHLCMQGDLVFNFIINDTPVKIEELLAEANMTKDEIDCFVCHQSSVFTLKKLRERLDVPKHKLPNDIVPIYGNSSSATIPVTITHHFTDIFPDDEKKKMFFAAFGTGLSIGGILMEMPKLDYCKFIDYQGIDD